MNSKGGSAKGSQPQHDLNRAVVKNRGNKGMYTPTMAGAKAGARGKSGKSGKGGK